MRAIKPFRDFLTEGIVKKQASDHARAQFLLNETEKSYLFIETLVKEMKITENNANSIIKLCYDVIMELLRAKMIEEGYNATGQGAHEAEVAYLREIGCSENDVQFADQMRYFRNRIMYYGKILDREYAETVFAFMKRIYPLLKKK